MLTKVSEEEQERGLAIAPPPPPLPLHEARSRSGGSWGSSNPGADMAGCEPTCRVRPGQARGRSACTGCGFYHLKRSEGEAANRAGRRRHAAAATMTRGR